MKGRTFLTTIALSLLLGTVYVAADTPLAPRCASGSTPRFEIVNNCGDDVWVVETPPGNQTHPTVPAQWDWFKAYTTQENPHIPGMVGLLLPKQTSQTFCVPDKGAPGGNFRFYMGCPANNTDPFNTSGCMLGAAAGDLARINTLFEPTFGCDPTLPASACAFNPAAGAPDWPQCQSDPNIAHCPPITPSDNFDISAVDGYTMPLQVDAQPRPGKHCNRLSTDASMLDLASCPTETDATLYSTNEIQQHDIDGGVSLLNKDDTALKACVAPYEWFLTKSLGSPPNLAPSNPDCDPITSACFYSAHGCDNAHPVTSCPGGSGPQQKVGPKGDGTYAVQNTNWVQQLFALGYGGYTWQYGDGVGDQTCDWGAQIKVTLCPAGGIPYQASQLWTFSLPDGDGIRRRHL